MQDPRLSTTSPSIPSPKVRQIARHAPLISIVVFLAAALFISTTANAALVRQVTNGILTGATGVDVAGTLYDVEFLDGTCVALFDGCDAESDFDFQGSVVALDAANALLAIVLLDGVDGKFDTTPNATRGCGNISSCQIITPYALAFSNNKFSSAVAVNNTSVDADSSPSPSFDKSFDTSSFDDFVFARWTRSVDPVPVPEPSVLPAIGIGFIAALLTRRRRTRQ